MILIHVPEITSRVEYTMNYIFGEILKIKCQLTDQETIFSDWNGARFSYGAAPVSNEPFFQSHHLLFENSVSSQHIEFIPWEGYNVFFPVKNGLLPFDIFAATFYLISRYEEYLPHQRDKHNRYSHQESVCYKGKFLEYPVVNIWVSALKKILEKHYPNLLIPRPAFTFTPTIDIDNAFAYQHKGLLRNSAQLSRHLLSLNFRRFRKRFKVMLRLEQDPFDSYEKQSMIHEKYHTEPNYFVLLGDLSKYDRNLSHTNSGYRKIIQDLSTQAKVGIHPSYNSNKSFDQLALEKSRLEEITNTPVIASRQHYLKIKLPETYRNLIRLGIKEDYSMGYAATGGYRAGTSTPFYFFDLEKNQKTDLKVIPFAFMDTGMKVYMKKKSKEVIPYVKQLTHSLRETGGHLTYIFHNESIGGKGMWKNWNNTYEDIIRTLLTDNK